MKALRIAQGRGSAISAVQKRSPCAHGDGLRGGLHDIFNPSRSYSAEPQSGPPRSGHLNTTNTVVSLLRSAGTKRDLRPYLSHFESDTKSPKFQEKSQAGNETQRVRDHLDRNLSKPGVNLGDLYELPISVQDNPVFAQPGVQEHATLEPAKHLHLALVKLRAPQLLDASTLNDVCVTLSQLTLLGLNSAVVLDLDTGGDCNVTGSFSLWRNLAFEQADRVVAALEIHNPTGAWRVDQAFKMATSRHHDVPQTVPIYGGVEVERSELLLAPLRNGTIPVIPPIAYSSDVPVAKKVSSDDVILALAREYSNIRFSGSEQAITDSTILDVSRPTSNPTITYVDRVIILDNLGGIPEEETNRAHVFINLEQEYKEIQDQLSRKPADESAPAGFAGAPTQSTSENGPQELKKNSNGIAVTSSMHQDNKRHTQNLNLVRQALTLLPPSSSALLTTPYEAATAALGSSDLGSASGDAPGVSTREQKNPLIYNLLTDKAMTSPSLPTPLRTSSGSTSHTSRSVSVTTLVKRGMPLTIIPDPRTHPWQPPTPSSPGLSLLDPRIDLARLTHLIEDSFGRTLDVQHYLSRVSHSLAGIIIAGEYEGGAIMTWETPSLPPGTSSRTPPAPVPYLDKFAVLRRSQGSGGVADVVFKALVRRCLPAGVVWRSRSDNPVNKWYFERADGMWRVPDTRWTMFWTGEPDGPERWRDYVDVCRAVQPSWKAKGDAE